mmetsp:Transcript_25448/g.38289  ORF Transcript_25448/g.38289 Transcript_25448/m.38289 type:complete len:207 (-) Transcript_25448:568-1188(-)
MSKGSMGKEFTLSSDISSEGNAFNALTKLHLLQVFLKKQNVSHRVTTAFGCYNVPKRNGCFGPAESTMNLSLWTYRFWSFWSAMTFLAVQNLLLSRYKELQRLEKDLEATNLASTHGVQMVPPGASTFPMMQPPTEHGGVQSNHPASQLWQMQIMQQQMQKIQQINQQQTQLLTKMMEQMMKPIGGSASGLTPTAAPAPAPQVSEI